jgi:hypothetical protein
MFKKALSLDEAYVPPLYHARAHARTCTLALSARAPTH